MSKVNLRGLPGINRLSDSEREAFYEANQDILNSNNFIDPREMEKAAEVLYNNKLFVQKFGMQTFREMGGNNAKNYEDRNAMLKTTIVEEAWNKYLSPFKADGSRDNNLGLGSLWEKYDDMSIDAKQKLLESDWQSPAEFKNEWDKYQKAYVQEQRDRRANLPGYNTGFGVTTGNESQIRMAGDKPKTIEDNSLKGKIKDFLGLVGGPEAERQKALERNDKVLENIYNEDLKNKAAQMRGAVGTAYFSPDIFNKSDDEIKKMFYNTFIDENSDLVKLGAGELATYWGEDELRDLSVDDMRQWLAKEKAYMFNMSPETAANILNNDAKKYVNAHQSNWTKAGLYAKDFDTSAYSYLGDKVDGLYTIGLDIVDRVEGSPTVYMNEAGEILDPKILVDPKSKVSRDAQGVQHYVDVKGNEHTVRAVQIPRTTLHQMGKNFDGSDAKNDWLNPLYRTRVEQFGTFDANEQKQYEKLGVSPYKVAYDPGEEDNFLWETAKMGVFGLVDMGSALVPFGIGMLGRTAAAVKGASALTRTAGRVADFLGRGLSYETKVGQAIQGSAGAIGIAEAYGRGAFQETLAKNQADAEATIQERAQREIFNRYNSDEEYKKAIDAEIDRRAAKLKQEDIRQRQKDSNTKIIESEARNKLYRGYAQKQYLEELTQQRIGELKQTKDWAIMQEQGIKHAGNAAMNTFYPGAIKYLFVNNLGYRQFIYKNPTGLSKPISSALKGIKEITTKEGRKRLVVEAPQFLTSSQKWAQLGRKSLEFGKSTVKQGWGGAWTNGTDDMMTDGAERISADSYSRYINGFLQGESLADLYGYTDGFYSYMKGFANSLGQDTTLNATLVGMTGSIFSGNVNFTNLASLATKSGRETYRNAYQQRYKRNADGTLAKDAEGKSITESLSWKDNWGQRAAFFIQNGVLNDYYGKMQSYRSQQEHADFVNQILDEYEDFEGIENLVLSDRALNEVIDEGDQKTARFIKALRTVNTLNALGNSKHDAATMSSVVEKAKQLVEETANMQFDADKDNLPEGEDIQNMLSQYYAANPGKEQNAYTARQGLGRIIKNAQKLQEAAEAYAKAEQEISNVEQKTGQQFSFAVRERLKENHALDGHWRQRLAKMKEEIGDTSTNAEVSQSVLISTLGGVTNAEKLARTYQQQEKHLTTVRDKWKKSAEEAQKKYDAAVATLDNNTDGTQQYALQKKVVEASAALEDAKLQLGHYEGQITSTQQRMKKLTDAITSFKGGEQTERVLTAQEIMTLNPMARARMLRNEVLGVNSETGKQITTRDIYSEAQKQEIEKLEKQLLMKDSDALQKIQDIALLTQRIDGNMDSYSKILKNPEAAAFRFEVQKEEAARDAYSIINRRNAQILADFIHQWDDIWATHKEVTQAQKEKFVYNILRGVRADVLEALDFDNGLPKYQKQLRDAIDWARVLLDLDAIISHADKEEAWKNNIRRNLDTITEASNSREELLANIEKAIDDMDNPAAVEDFDYVMQKLVSYGHQRNATVLEKRKERKEREEAERTKRAAEKKAAEEAAQATAAEAAARAAEAVVSAAEEEAQVHAEAVAQAEAAAEAVHAEEWGNTKTQNPVPANGEGLQPVSISAEEAQAEHRVDEHSVEDESKRQDVELDENKKDRSKKSEEAVGDDAYSGQVTETEDEVLIQSPSLEAQASKDEGEKVQVTAGVESDSSANAHGEQIIKFDAHTLSGNAMSEWNPGRLEEDGVLEHKQGKNPRDHMNKFYAWMDSAGIHLQNIIDHELVQILADNLHLKVKFMSVRSEFNATKDNDVAGDIFLVVDYDNSINKNITHIHNAANGGVIESGGKKYLIIGVAGWSGGKESPKFALYDILHNTKTGLLYSEGKGQHFKKYPGDRFYVPDGVTTEIVPMSLIPGYIVKQLETDAYTEYRSVTELLKDDSRNPKGLTFDGLVWGIQETSQFLVVGTSSDNVMAPTDQVGNTGRAFVFVPAANGKLVPSYLQPLFYTEMKDGSLKSRVNQLLNDVLSYDYQRRKDAVMKLSSIFYFDPKEGDGILLRKSRAEISLVHDGEVVNTFVLNSDFDRQAFFTAFNDINPRVNITKKVLEDKSLLREYDEAGALTTDVARLSTAGSSYSIYGVDSKGRMLQPETPSNPKPAGSGNSFRNADRNQVVYKHKYYTTENGNFYLNGIPVTDATTIEQLTYNQRIVEGNYEATKKDGIWEYYILSEGENLEVVKVNKNTKEVVKATDAQAEAFREEFLKKAEAEARETAAIEALNHPTNLEDVTLDEDGMLVIPTEPTTETIGGKEASSTESPTKQKEGEGNVKTPARRSVPDSTQSSVTQSFETLCRKPKQRIQISTLVKKKWKDAPKKGKELAEYLRKKNIEVDAIGTSEEDIQAWMKTIEECR